MTESKIPELKEGVDKAREQVKNLVWWLPDPHKCDNCNSYCDATTEYVESQVMYMDIWKCPECGNRYFRERG